MTDQTLAAFVLFIRLNPGIPVGDPVIRRAFDAYRQLDYRDAQDQARAAWQPGAPIPPGRRIRDNPQA